MVGSCKFAECSLGGWSEWEPKELKEDQCGQRQTRRKTYFLSFAYRMYVGQCPSLPQTCPDDIVEDRTQCGKSYKWLHAPSILIVKKEQITKNFLGLNSFG